MSAQNRGGRPQVGMRISRVILSRIKREAEQMDVTLTSYIQSVLWDHIRELDRPKVEPVQTGFRALGS